LMPGTRSFATPPGRIEQRTQIVRQSVFHCTGFISLASFRQGTMTNQHMGLVAKMTRQPFSQIH
jgi:hypothetical protein